MADYSGVKIDGARRLRSTLRKAGADMRDMREVNRVVAGIVVGAATARVPRRTGALAATVRAGATQAAAIGRAGNNRRTGVPYANPIHWGWHRHRIRPNPFLSLAAQDTEPTWFGVYADGIEKIISNIEGA